MNKQKKKQAIAAVVALSILVAGTYAWQSFSQTIINETAGFDADQGTRLHNDFDGSNADVYVENFASTTAGSTVYTRVRLHEYMEIGAGAGSLTGASSATTIPGDLPVDAGNITPDITDVTTWDIYLHEGNSHETSIRDYLNLNYGDEMNVNQGATVYMPTFNKNFDDTTAEINGSLNNLGNREDTDRDNATPYDDYTTYSLGESISATATYSKDALIAQESTEGEIVGTTFEIEETHTAKSTQTGSVITMAEWKDRVAAGTSDQVGDYWVMDTDGWAYWANGLAPQTATSLLVDSISTVRTPDQDWHYGLHVVNQSATSDGWVDAAAAMNKGDIGEDVLDLMDICWGTDAATYEVTDIVLATQAKSSLLVGEELEFSATVTTPETAEKAKTVLWTIEEVATDATSEVASISSSGSGLSQGQINASLSSTGVFKPTNTAMHMQSYIITATAKYDTTKSQSTTITVYDPEQPCIIVTAADDVTEVTVGETLQFTAQVIGVDSQDVTWSVSDGHGAINTGGLLTTAYYVSENDYITVVAESATRDIKGSVNITVQDGNLTNLDLIDMVGTTDAVFVNGVEFYVIGYDNTNFSRSAVKILRKTGTTASAFGSNSTYSSSTVRTGVLNWYNNTFLPGGDLTDADVCYEGTTTRSSGSPTITTSDKAFLLSSGEASNLSSTVRTTGAYYWLRTSGGSSGAARMNQTGTIDSSIAVSAILPLRPALWIYL